MDDKLVLVVDDEEDIVRILKRWLSLVPGVSVLSVPDGAHALETAKSKHPDLIILDYLMPMMDGFETCRALRADAATKTIPIIILSGMGAVGAEMGGESCGADAYLPKPLEGMDLVVCVQKLLNRPVARP